MSVIYAPKGKAGEYAKLALNIYNGCSHGCTYCYSPAMNRKSREEFMVVSPRKDLLKKLETDLKRGHVRGNNKEIIELKGVPIHLCFTCDPYPYNVDTTITNDVIELIKRYGYNVQILTKSGERSTSGIELLDENDWYGFTFTGFGVSEYEPYAASPQERISATEYARGNGVKTWVSCEPVINPTDVEFFIEHYGKRYDLVKIGKPNYVEFPFAPHDWKDWGKHILEICEENGVNGVLKDSLK